MFSLWFTCTLLIFVQIYGNLHYVNTAGGSLICKSFANWWEFLRQYFNCFYSVTAPQTPDVTLTSPESQNQPHTAQMSSATETTTSTTSTTVLSQNQQVSSRPVARPQTLPLSTILTPARMNVPVTTVATFPGQNLPLATQSNLAGLATGLNLVPYGQGQQTQPRYGVPGEANTIQMPALQQGIVGIGMGFSVGNRRVPTGQQPSDVTTTVPQPATSDQRSSGAIPKTSTAMTRYVICKKCYIFTNSLKTLYSVKTNGNLLMWLVPRYLTTFKHSQIASFGFGSMKY